VRLPVNLLTPDVKLCANSCVFNSGCHYPGSSFSATPYSFKGILMLRLAFSVFIVLHGLVYLLYFGQSRKFFELQPGLLWPDGLLGILQAPRQ
jgi:hypothetical protein